jgi:hypothetical protein
MGHVFAGLARPVVVQLSFGNNHRTFCGSNTSERCLDAPDHTEQEHSESNQSSHQNLAELLCADEDLPEVFSIEVGFLADIQAEGSGERIDEEVTELVLI